MAKNVTRLLDSNDEKEIQNLIYDLRNQKVMLDSDIARLFDTNTKTLNQQMKRNAKRFPEDFCMQLNSKEFKNLRSHFVTFRDSTKGRKYLPYMYTEEGIIALAGVLKSDIADEMCVKISRVFIKMKNTLVLYSEPLKFLSKIYGEFIDFKIDTIKKFDQIFIRLEKIEPKKEVLLLDDEWFDAFEAVIKLIERAKETIVLVDPYLDDKSLVFLSHINHGVKITAYKSEFAKLKDEEVEAFSKQYGEIVIKEYNKSHNRYLILDSDEVYDLGYSLNKIGNKIFTINKIEIKEVRETLIKLFK